MRGGSTEPARIVAGELFRSVTVKLEGYWSELNSFSRGKLFQKVQKT